MITGAFAGSAAVFAVLALILGALADGAQKTRSKRRIAATAFVALGAAVTLALAGIWWEALA